MEGMGKGNGGVDQPPNQRMSLQFCKHTVPEHYTHSSYGTPK